VDPARDLPHLDPVGRIEEPERAVPEAAAVEQEVERDDDRQHDVERAVEQAFGGPDRALRRLEERRDRGLDPGGDLLGRERHVADRHAVRAEQLPERGRQRVRATVDQQGDLPRDRPRERHHDEADDEERGAVAGDDDQQPGSPGPGLR
jgi:hypothetical protein